MEEQFNQNQISLILTDHPNSTSKHGRDQVDSIAVAGVPQHYIGENEKN